MTIKFPFHHLLRYDELFFVLVFYCCYESSNFLAHFYCFWEWSILLTVIECFGRFQIFFNRYFWNLKFLDVFYIIQIFFDRYFSNNFILFEYFLTVILIVYFRLSKNDFFTCFYLDEKWRNLIKNIKEESKKKKPLEALLPENKRHAFKNVKIENWKHFRLSSLFYVHSSTLMFHFYYYFIHSIMPSNNVILGSSYSTVIKYILLKREMDAIANKLELNGSGVGRRHFYVVI